MAASVQGNVLHRLVTGYSAVEERSVVWSCEPAAIRSGNVVREQVLVTIDRAGQRAHPHDVALDLDHLGHGTHRALADDQPGPFHDQGLVTGFVEVHASMAESRRGDPVPTVIAHEGIPLVGPRSYLQQMATEAVDDLA